MCVYCTLWTAELWMLISLRTLKGRNLIGRYACQKKRAEYSKSTMAFHGAMMFFLAQLTCQSAELLGWSVIVHSSIITFSTSSQKLLAWFTSTPHGGDVPSKSHMNRHFLLCVNFLCFCNFHLLRNHWLYSFQTWWGYNLVNIYQVCSLACVLISFLVHIFGKSLKSISPKLLGQFLQNHF